MTWILIIWIAGEEPYTKRFESYEACQRERQEVLLKADDAVCAKEIK